MQCNSVENFASSTANSASTTNNSSGFSVDGLAALQNYLADFSKELDQSQEHVVIASSDDHVTDDDCYPSTSIGQVLYVDDSGVTATEIVDQSTATFDSSRPEGSSIVAAGLAQPKSDESNNENLTAANVVPLSQPIILTLSQGATNIVQQPQQQQQSFLIPLNISGGNAASGATTILLPINSFVSSEGVIELRVAAPSASSAQSTSTGPILFLVNNSSNGTPGGGAPSLDGGLCSVVIDNSSANTPQVNVNSTKPIKSQIKRKENQKKFLRGELRNNSAILTVDDADKEKDDDRYNSSVVDDVIKRVVSGVDDDDQQQEEDYERRGEGECEEEEEENEETSKMKCLKTYDTTTFQCQFCDYTNPKRYLMLRHLKSHSEDRPHKCPVCERRFKTPNSLQNHINTHTGIRPHQCKMCNASFTTSGEMVRHIRYRHTLEKPHKCPHCDYASVELSKLKRHMRSHSGERPFQCPNCLYASPDTYKLKRHMRVHTGEKPYECDVCLQRFTQSNSLKAHKKIHSGEKPVFQCEFCPSSCGRKTDLKIHVQKLHGQCGPVPCKKCANTFPDRYSYKLHMKTHEVDRSYQCQACDYCAQSMRGLNLHMTAEHDAVEPCASPSDNANNTDNADNTASSSFTCTDCGLPFRSNRLLKRHKNAFHPIKEKLFVCSFCPKRFSLDCNLMKHLEEHERRLKENDVLNKSKNQKTTIIQNELDEEDDTDSDLDAFNACNVINNDKNDSSDRLHNFHGSEYVKTSNKKRRRIRLKPEQLGLTNVRRRGRPTNPSAEKSANSVQVSPKKPRPSIVALDDDQKAKDVENLFGFASSSTGDGGGDDDADAESSSHGRSVVAPVTTVSQMMEVAPETSMEPLLVISDHASSAPFDNGGAVPNRQDEDSVDNTKNTKYEALIIDNAATNIFDLTTEERLEIVTLANSGTSAPASSSAVDS